MRRGDVTRTCNSPPPRSTNARSACSRAASRPASVPKRFCGSPPRVTRTSSSTRGSAPGCGGAARGWEDGDLHAYIKAGKDQNNFYLYHAPARTSSWDPEMVVDLDRWLLLRAKIEQVWLRGDTAQIYAGCPDTSLVPFDSAYVMCDGPYLAHVLDPA